jgi:hypothetical protein
MKVELNIPTNLSEITLSAFQKYLKISEGQQDDNFFLKHKAIEIFCGVPLLTVSNMRQIDVNDINEKIAIVLEQKPRLQQTFNLDGLNFGFIPNLEDMTAGEYIDLDTYIQNMDTMHKALAVLYRPIKTKLKDKYLIEDYEGSDKYSSIMKDVSLEVAFGASVFFWDLGRELLSSSIHYLQAHQQEIQTTLDKHNLGKSGDGTTQFMQHLEAMLQSTTISQN